MKQLAFAIWYNNETQTLEMEKNGKHVWSQVRAGGYVGESEVVELISRYVNGQLIELEGPRRKAGDLTYYVREMRKLVDNARTCGTEQRVVRLACEAFEMIHKTLVHHGRSLDKEEWHSA